MKFTLSWLKTHLETDADLGTLTEALTHLGLEVEQVTDPGAELAAFRIAHVVEAEKHPNADRLRVCKVDTGAGLIQVVCGAPNARAGMKAVLALPGTLIPRDKYVLKVGEIRGQASQGMLCSASEMNLGGDADGILDLPADAPIGAPYAAWAGLDDPVIEIAVTPNRADALGVRGIARDLAAVGLGTLKAREIPQIPATIASDFKIEIADEGACPLFIGRIVRGVRNGPSPDWLRRRLESLGLRPISALVDITNFTTFDNNRPLHVFDLDRLAGGMLRIHPAAGGETLAALNGKDYTLDAGMCLISDAEQAVSLAGIMGGAATGCGPETVNILIEAALFDPLLTARTGRRLGINSDARYRFERGIDRGAVVEGIEWATGLILDLCGGEPGPLITAGTLPEPAPARSFRPARVAALTGVAVPAVESARILTALGFTVEGDDPDLWQVRAPLWRDDIHGEADLVEEIVRVHGYHHIPATPLPPLSDLPALAISPAQRRTSETRRLLAGRGLSEAVTWSFVEKSAAETFGGAPPALTLSNPIASDLDQMRPSLLPNLLKAGQRNQAHGVADVALFELGPAYRGIAPDAQDLVAAGLRIGNMSRASWSKSDRAVDIFDAKADALAVLTLAGVPIDNLQTWREAPDWYHPGRSGVLKLGPKALARFGEIHPRVRAAYDLTAPHAVFEIFLDAIPLPKARSGRARPPFAPPAYPAVTRDFAFVVADTVAAETLLRAVRGAEKTLIEQVDLFDVYVGKGVPDGQKSLALSVRLQPTDKTLTEADIDAVAEKITAAAAKTCGAVLRG